jgi:hypothetical protein
MKTKKATSFKQTFQYKKFSNSFGIAIAVSSFAAIASFIFFSPFVHTEPVFLIVAPALVYCLVTFVTFLGSGKLIESVCRFLFNGVCNG